MTWSINNTAHRATWALVRYSHKNVIEQEGFVKFKEGGEWLNDLVIGSAAGEVAEVKANKAESFATKLDEFFISLFGANYESEQTKGTAIAAVASAFLVAGSKLNSVGDIVDKCYQMKEEV